MTAFWARRQIVTQASSSAACVSKNSNSHGKVSRTLTGLVLATALSTTGFLLPSIANAVEEDAVVIESVATLPSSDELVLLPGSTASVTFTVPQGMSPTSFTAQVNGVAGEMVQIISTTRNLATVDGASGAIDIAVSPEDMAEEENSVTLTFSYEGYTGTWCALDGAATGTTPPVIISDIQLNTSGEAQTPASVGEFFDGSQTAIITIPADADQAVAFAALDLVAGATAIMGQDSDVRLVVAGSAQAEAVAEELASVPAVAQRLVSLSAADSEVVTSIERSESGAPQLTISGDAAALADSAAAFGMPGLALASSADTSQLAAVAGGIDVTAAEQTKTLGDLGISNISLQGYGSKDAYVGISQGSFGSMLDSIDVNLVGTVSSTAETIATVQLLWNSVLVDSFTVNPDESQIDRTITVPAAALRSGNGLVIRMQAVNAAQTCIDERLLPQVRMDLSTAESTVTAHRGASPMASFQDFPQVFSGNAELAFGAEATPAQITSAAQLVAALQRSQPVRLGITGVEAKSLISSSASGILVGATADQAEELRTPLRFADLRRIAASGDELTVSVDQPYAALQAIRQSDRSLLVLGEYLGESDADSSVMIAATSELAGSDWLQLDGAIRLSTPGADPAVLDVNEIIPQDEAKDDFNPIALWAIGLLVALIAIGLIAANVRKRRKATAERTAASEENAEKEAVIASELAEVTAPSQPQHAAAVDASAKTTVNAADSADSESRPNG